MENEQDYEKRSADRRRTTLVTAFALALVSAGRPAVPPAILTDAERIADELLKRHPQAML